MAASIGNLAIVISGNARPFQQTLGQVQNNIRQFSVGTQNIYKAPPGSQMSGMRLQWGSFGRLARSALVAGFGGGLAGALVGVGAMAFGQVAEAAIGVAGAVGKQAAMFLADSFQEGLKVSRMELGVNFLAGGPARGGEWMKEIRSLSAKSGFDMLTLGQSMRTLAGSTDELDNVLPTLQAIATISAGIGAEAEQMNRFALAVAQVTAAGRFEAQELNQLTEAGMPIKELAKTAGMSVGKFRAAVKDGEVSVSVLAETFNRMVGPGGRFFGMLEERAKSAVGQVDRISASWLLLKQDLGKGLLEGARSSGTLDAIQAGINKMTGLISDPAVIDRAFNGMKDLGMAGLRVAGVVYDTATYWGGIADRIYRAYKGLEQIYRIVRIINPGIALFNPVAGIEGMLKINPLNPLNYLKDNGTGNQWAKDFAEAFTRSGVPIVQQAFNGIVISPQLSPKLQKMLDGVQEQLAAGATPFDKFLKTMGDVEKIREFDFMQASSGGLFDRAFGAISPRMSAGVEEQLLVNAFNELEKSLHMTAAKFPEAMSKGSKEAASVLANAAFGGQGKSIQEKILETARLAKKAQEETAKNTEATAKALSGLRAQGLFR